MSSFHQTDSCREVSEKRCNLEPHTRILHQLNASDKEGNCNAPLSSNALVIRLRPLIHHFSSHPSLLSKPNLPFDDRGARKAFGKDQLGKSSRVAFAWRRFRKEAFLVTAKEFHQRCYLYSSTNNGRSGCVLDGDSIITRCDVCFQPCRESRLTFERRKEDRASHASRPNRDLCDRRYSMMPRATFTEKNLCGVSWDACA